jgi:hypothetical protein
MTVYRIYNVYQKNGAVFSNGLEAFFDKNRLFSDELKQAVADTSAELNEKGIFIKPNEYHWDQETFTLTIVRELVNFDEFIKIQKFTTQEADDFSAQAGWTLVERRREQI